MPRKTNPYRNKRASRIQNDVDARILKRLRRDLIGKKPKMNFFDYSSEFQENSNTEEDRN